MEQEDAATARPEEKYINIGTKMPLFVGANDVWVYDGQKRIVEVKDMEKALDRGWGQKNGAHVGWWTKHGGVNQKFDFVALL